MKKQLYFILMADVINSRKAQQNDLMADFKKIVTNVNLNSKTKILSPLTITLGDEFQGVIKDLQSAIEIIIQLEEEIIDKKAHLALRYVLFEGEIETSINTKIAYEMLGSGLTMARSYLMELKSDNDRFHIIIQDKIKSKVLNDGLRVYQGIVDEWDVDKDFEMINYFLKYKDYKVVADKLKRNRSVIWKRERTSKVKEYISLKNVILYLGMQ